MNSALGTIKILCGYDKSIMLKRVSQSPDILPSMRKTKQADTDGYRKMSKLNLASGDSSYNIPRVAKFSLDYDFIRKMRNRQAPWSGKDKEDVLAALVYYRTYSRGNEPWWHCVKRIVEGAYTIQVRHYMGMSLHWDVKKAQRSAQEMYRRMFDMKFLPPGRGLWVMGTPIIEERGLAAALNNCSFVSTKDMDKNPTRPFTFLMDGSMLGVGTGGDTKGAGKCKIYQPGNKEEVYVVPDSREGWVKSVEILLNSYMRPNKSRVVFDYNEIRKEGVPLKTFGGVSSGPGPLVELHDKLHETLARYIGGTLDSRGIVDIFNLIGVCVVSGNIRRTAEICFGEPGDEDFLDLKNYEKNPDRAAYGWTSNNSVFANAETNYDEIAKRIHLNGEPGVAWLDNMRKYSRMCDPPDNKDYRVMGGNPCLNVWGRKASCRVTTITSLLA